MFGEKMLDEEAEVKDGNVGRAVQTESGQSCSAVFSRVQSCSVVFSRVPACLFPLDE